MKKILSSCLLLALTTPCFADGLLPEKATVLPTPANVAMPISPLSEKQFASNVSLDAGTRVPVTIYNTVSSDNLKTGDMISISVNEPVKLNGTIIFKKGSQGILNISKSVKSGGHGRPGILEINGGRITDVFGNQHPINVSLSSKGSSKRGWAIAATVLGIVLILTPFGIWIDGTPATIQGGQYIDALTTTSMEIDIPNVQQSEVK